MKRLIFLVLLLPVTALAQEKPAEMLQQQSIGNIYNSILFGTFIIAALIILISSLALLKAVKVMAEELSHPRPFAEPLAEPAMEYEEWAAAKKAKPGFWTKILGLRPLSEEKDLMMEHTFDGIAELDNPTPGWFMWLFYSTIVFAVCYLAYYHVLPYGMSQEEEYAVELKIADAERSEYLSKSANNIDETTVKESSEANVISSGQSIFNANCVACHGDKGQGLVGPNLTDDYWLHGGEISEIFKTVKYGVPEKGMISWEKTLTPKQISDVANFILTLRGTNPPNGKAPQGDKEG